MHQPHAEPRRSIYYRYQVHAPWLASAHPPQDRKKVVIVGAGPIGLFAALELARLGVPCVLLESELQVSEGSRAIVFTRRSMEILQQVGVDAPITANGLPWRFGNSFYRGQRVYRMEAPHDPDDRFFPMINLQQQYLEQYLTEAVLANPLIEMRWGNRVTRIDHNEVADVLGMAGGAAASVTREGLDWLLDRLLKARRADNLRIEGLKDDRRAVIGGGLAVLRAVFDLLEIDEMRAAEGALRQGALYDLLDREHIQTDVRATTVQRLTRKFGVDTVHANRVSRIACGLFRQMRPGMTESQAGRLENKLAWAAQLHEIGAQISHSDYHKHGAYILGNSDAPGFSLSELERLGQLVLGHRGKLAKLVIDFNDVTFVQQLLALRLAVVLCHARRDPDLKDLVVACNLNSPRRVSVSLRDGWSEAWPQSAHLLREEANAWQRTPWSLQILQS
jgi:hypothetical protein